MKAIVERFTIQEIAAMMSMTADESAKWAARDALIVALGEWAKVGRYDVAIRLLGFTERYPIEL